MFTPIFFSRNENMYVLWQALFNRPTNFAILTLLSTFVGFFKESCRLSNTMIDIVFKLRQKWPSSRRISSTKKCLHVGRWLFGALGGRLWSHIGRSAALSFPLGEASSPMWKSFLKYFCWILLFLLRPQGPPRICTLRPFKKYFCEK